MDQKGRSLNLGKKYKMRRSKYFNVRLFGNFLLTKTPSPYPTNVLNIEAKTTTARTTHGSKICRCVKIAAVMSVISPSQTTQKNNAK